MRYEIKPVVAEIMKRAKLTTGLTIVRIKRSLESAASFNEDLKPEDMNREFTASVLRGMREDAIKENRMRVIYIYDNNLFPNARPTPEFTRLENEVDASITFRLTDNGLLACRIDKLRTVTEEVLLKHRRSFCPMIPVVNKIGEQTASQDSGVVEGMVLASRAGFNDPNTIMTYLAFNRTSAVFYVMVPDVGVDWVFESPVFEEGPVLLLAPIIRQTFERGIPAVGRGAPYTTLTTLENGYNRSLYLVESFGDTTITDEGKTCQQMFGEYLDKLKKNNPDMAVPALLHYSAGDKKLTETSFANIYV